MSCIVISKIYILVFPFFCPNFLYILSLYINQFKEILTYMLIAGTTVLVIHQFRTRLIQHIYNIHFVGFTFIAHFNQKSIGMFQPTASRIGLFFRVFTRIFRIRICTFTIRCQLHNRSIHTFSFVSIAIQIMLISINIITTIRRYHMAGRSNIFIFILILFFYLGKFPCSQIVVEICPVM